MALSTEGLSIKHLLILYDKCFGSPNLTLTEYDHKPLIALTEWLQPIYIPDIPYFELHWFESNWVTGRLSQIFGCPEYIIVFLLREIYDERNR